MQQSPEKKLTDLINEMQLSGANVEDVYKLVYSTLKEIASKVLSRADESQMSASDLLHTVYLQKLRNLRVPVQNRQHFYAIGARAMKQVVLDEAKARRTAKRSLPPAGAPEWRWAAGEATINPEQFALVNPLLEKLALIDPQAAQVIEMRVILGFTIEEVAELMDLKPKKVREDWDFAKQWLKTKLEGSASK